MAQDRNTHEKRLRETRKRQKAEDKRVRRQRKKEAADSPETIHSDEPAADQQ